MVNWQKEWSKVESAINYRPSSIIGRARALTLAATIKLIAKDRWVNVGWASEKSPSYPLHK